MKRASYIRVFHMETFALGICWPIAEKTGLIDWEMAAIHPVGYDLFTFVFHVNFVLGGDKLNIARLLTEHEHWFNDYFNALGIEDYKPYLTDFIVHKIESEKSKGHEEMVNKYIHLQQIING